MKRVLLLGAAVALFVAPTALGAGPASTAKTMRGIVVAKDKAHHGLVVASSAGAVRTISAPLAFAKTNVGRRVVVRYRVSGGGLPVAVGVDRGGEAGKALVRGTIIRLRKGHAVLSAGGSALSVSLKTPKRQRQLSSSGAGPQAGDEVEIEVEIDDDGSLDATGVTVTSAGAPSAQFASEGELEVRGTVTALSPAVVVKTGTGVVVTCVIPAGTVPTGIAVGDLVELKCDLIGGQWTLRKAHGEDDDEQGQDDSHGSKVKVRGTLNSLDPLTVTLGAGTPVVCVVPVGVSLAGFVVGDSVKMECMRSGDTLTLHELEKKHGTGDHAAGGELEVKGMLTSLDPLTVKRGSGELVTCRVPTGVSLAGLVVGQVVELKCRTIDGVPTLERLKVEGPGDDHEDDGSNDDSGENDD
jgi:hypothetical protein